MFDPLLSHPDRLLVRHVQEVRDTAQAIVAYHGGLLEGPVRHAATLHDIGKGTPAFQRYIRRTDAYRGDRRAKAHTPLGLAVAGRYAQCHGFDDAWLLQVGLAILGHHSSLPTRGDVENKLNDDQWVAILLRQLDGLPVAALEQALALPADDLRLAPTPLKQLLWEVSERYEEAFEAQRELYSQDRAAAIARRLQVQYVYSVLLEADRALLALSVSGQSFYMDRQIVPWPADLVQRFVERQPHTPLNDLRTQAREDALATLRTLEQPGLLTLTLPTGLGKTLTAVAIARALCARQPRQIIVVMPFLSIIDQTAAVYRDLLGLSENADNSERMMQSHSLSEVSYEETEEGDAAFLLDIWSSDLVLTTIDQLLLALLGARARHQMRFHHLAGSVLILDEIQAIPTHLWDLCRVTLEGLAREFGTIVLAMSATQPGFIDGVQELYPAPATLFRRFARYRLLCHHRESRPLEAFIDALQDRREELATSRVLVTLNTRASARAVYDALCDVWPAPVMLLSADLTPRDRLDKIERIRSGREPVLVVSTQVVEAGVDIDMDVVLRDFAPLDALIQIAGRCNRHGRSSRGTVEIYTLTDDGGRRYADMVYRNPKGGPDYSLETTRAVLEGYSELPEEEIHAVVESYFALLRAHKNLGASYTRDYATFEEQLDVSELLRGEKANRMQLIVASRDPDGDLDEAITAALAASPRFVRRRALQKLAGRIAAVTVSVWVRGDWRPEAIADPLVPERYRGEGVSYPWWIVRTDCYDTARGIIMDGAFII